MILKLQFNNKHEPNAIEMIIAKGESLGYVMYRMKRQVVRPLMDQGLYLYGLVHGIVGGNGMNYRFNSWLKTKY